MQGTRLELFSEKLMFKGNNKMYFLLKGQHEEAELFRWPLIVNDLLV